MDMTERFLYKKQRFTSKNEYVQKSTVFESISVDFRIEIAIFKIQLNF